MLGMFCLCQRPVTAHGCSRCPLWQPCAATGRWHYSIVRTMTPSNHALRVSFVCSKAWVVCSCCCFVGIVATATVVLQHSSKFVATIAVTARLKFVGKAAYIFGVAERVLGVGEESWILAVLDGRYVAGYVRRWEGVVGGYQPWMWRGPCCGYHNR